MQKLRVAVFFGGPSTEHDVSILTGLQALEALDPTRYEALPVYIDLQGQWWVGHTQNNPLLNRASYLLTPQLKQQLTRVTFPVGASRDKGGWFLQAAHTPLLGRAQRFPFDVALPALHGTWGEDGTLQGVLAAENVPVAGGGVGPMSLTIHKAFTAVVAASVGIPCLPGVVVGRGDMPDLKALTKKLGPYPLFIKPNTLGSSIGVHKVPDDTALQAALQAVHALDTHALIQPCIEHLAEYNVSVRRLPSGGVVTSAIERPLRQGDAYDFKTKYLSGGGQGKKMGQKVGGDATALRGIIAATRSLHPPELKTPEGQKLAATMRTHAVALFKALDMAGAPRLDFMLNEKTGQLYFNEINPIPGSFGFFLWEDAEEKAATGLTGLISAMLEEARARARSHFRLADPSQSGGAIFTRRG